MASDVADLYVTLRAETAPMVTGFARAGASGEEMAAAITRSVGAVQADAAKASRSLGEVGLSAERLDVQVTTSSAGVARAMTEVSNSAAVTATKWNVEMARMEATTAKLTANVEAQALKAEASIKGMGDAMAGTAAKADAGFLSKLEGSKTALVGVGVAAIGAAYETTKMAGDFQQSTIKLVTSAGESEQGLAVVRQGMLQLAGEVGVSATHLSDAMYKIGSAGYHAEAGLGVLKAAEQGAKAEGADGVRVADALSSALRDYYPHAQKAAEVTAASTDVMSKLIGATSAGKMTFDDLAGALNSILPVSSAANISLTDTLGVLASMTVHGISAQQATQNMADAIRHLQAPTGTMITAMGMLGLDANKVAAELGQRGLSGTMQMLSERVRDFMPPGSQQVILQLGEALSKSTPQVQALGQKLMEGTISMAAYHKEAKALDPISASQANSFATLAASTHKIGTQQISGAEVMKTYGGLMQQVMGDATGLKVALMTTGENAGYTSDAIKTITNSTADASGNVKGWSEVQHGFNQKMSEAKAGLGALAISIGNVLLPAMTAIAGVVANVTSWLSRHKEVATVLAGVIGTVLVAGLVAATIAMVSFTVAALANPVVWIVVGIMALIAGIVLLVTHWKDVEKFLSGAWNAFISWAKDLWNSIAGFFKDLWGSIAGFFTDVWKDVSKGVSDAWDGMISFFKSIPGKIGSALDSLGSLLTDLAKKGWEGFTYGLVVAFNATLDFLGRLPNMIGFGLGFLAGTLYRLAVDGWNSFTHGLAVAYQATVRFFTDLPGNVDKFFTGVDKWLTDRGRELVDGLSRGIDVAYKAVVQFFVDLPGNIDRFAIDANNWLVARGRELVYGLGHGIDVGWNATAKFFWDLPGVIGRFFNGVWDWLAWHGRALIDGLGRGIGDSWNGLGKWLWDLPGNITRIFDGAERWLEAAGWNIIVGLWNGITRAGSWLWDRIASFGSAVVAGFNAAMGNHSPSVLMAEAGRNIVLGLANGIADHARTAVAAAEGMASKVAAAGSGSVRLNVGVSGQGSTAGGLGSGSPMVSGIGGAGGAGTTIVQVYIQPQGSIYAENDLLRVVQRAVLQYTGRNPNSGWNPGVI